MANFSAENNTITAGISGWRVKLPGVLLVVTALLLPLKWGTIAAMTEAAGFFPADVTAYFTITWAAHSFGIWSGLLLLITACCLPYRGNLRNPGSVMTVLWSAGIVLAAAPGCLASGRDIDFAWGEFSNTAGIAAWALAVGLMHSADTRWLKRMAAALLVGVLITACYAYYQYFFGFDELKKFVAEQMAAGINIPEAIQLKMADTRVTSFMASPNALAGVILIVLPLIFYFGREWGKNFSPVKVSVPLFCLTGLLITGGALLLCRSRSVILTVIVAGVLAAFSAPAVKLRYKVIAGILALILIVGGAFFALRYGRGFGSMAERADYLRTSAVLVMENPLIGAGWGSFFYRHMEIKLSSTDEAARDPHNVVAAFAGQCGIPAGLLLAAALLYPLVMLWKHRFDRSWQCAVFWSGLFFTLHILMDCDFHIPAIMAGILLLYFSALPQPCGELSRKSRWMLPLFAGFAILAGAGNVYFLRGEIKLADFTDFLNPGDVNSRSRYVGVAMEKVESAAVQARPGLALIPELAGDYFFAHGDIERAHERYLKALMLNPRRPGIYRRLARLACRRGDFDAGVKLLKKAHGLFPRNPKYSLEHPDNRLMFPVDFNFTAEDVK